MAATALPDRELDFADYLFRIRISLLSCLVRFCPLLAVSPGMPVFEGWPPSHQALPLTLHRL
jgi:hypothetical protein